MDLQMLLETRFLSVISHKNNMARVRQKVQTINKTKNDSDKQTSN